MASDVHVIDQVEADARPTGGPGAARRWAPHPTGCWEWRAW